MSLIIVLQNVSDLAPVSDYRYRVLVGDGGPRSRVLETGTVTNHIRAEGWDALLRQLLLQRKPKKG